jgi:hypothetical protein
MSSLKEVLESVVKNNGSFTFRADPEGTLEDFGPIVRRCREALSRGFVTKSTERKNKSAGKVDQIELVGLTAKGKEFLDSTPA